MRKLKFRVFYKKEKIYYTGDNMRVNGNGEIEIFSFYGPDHQWFKAPESCELVRFTGLFDCQGKEIWEDDIVEREDGKRSFVVFDEGSFRAEWGGANSLTKGILMNMHIPGIKVVGNRFNGIEAQEAVHLEDD